MVAVHGGDVEFVGTTLTFRPSELARALRVQACELPLDSSCSWELDEPTALSCGSLTVRSGGDSVRLTLAPNQAAVAQDLVRVISGIATGEGMTIPGLNCVLASAEFAHGDPGQLVSLSLARVRDGQIAQDATLKGEEIIPRFTEFLGQDILVAYNAQPLMLGLAQSARAHGVEAPDCDFGCVLALASAQAASAQAASAENGGRRVTLSATISDTLSLLGAATANAEDPSDLRALWAAASLRLGHSTAEGKVEPVVRDRLISASHRGTPRSKTKAAGDGSAASSSTPAEHADGSGSATPPVWAKVQAPDSVPEANPNASKNNALFGQNVTLTGEFSPFDKGQLWQRIADCGATVGKNVTKKTTILVCGPWNGITSKQKKAEKYREQGQDIEFWDQPQLLQVLGLDEQPPF
ncbi:DNA polymerase III subunit epsilon [Corynebacterium ciconiae DSM 44920]|uniref:BRCT domain-containing protein n=1 Tax=Corynebacterium ciconiae TaxID=227319 RepID=UPI00035F07F5|nr:BRCT domain-containing protein [Corynebacterium ciconiae]WKD60816.1 DNA polymerase III subunit epsilon [Corynebacterium ciconiae DSM 44920]